MLHPYLQHDGPIPFAHRGGAKAFPENTLLSFQRCHEIGYRWFETDVHLTADGEIVVFHDHTLDRCTNGKGPIGAKTLAELKQLDAGWHWEEHRGTGVTIPTLHEALDLGDDYRLNLEIKHAKPSMAKALWDLIRDRGVLDRVLVASANDKAIQEFRQVSGGGTATSAALGEIARYFTGVQLRPGSMKRPPYDALQIPMSWFGIPVATRRFVEVSHRLGLSVHVWTIDEPADMRALIELGVDGVMSDLPELLWAVMHEGAAPA